ncbi:protein TolR [Rhodovulum sp. DZ06]|uniref:protein TolR n=1 Tax=Rhodovulum sp. DZ06 TaxID=3425126 RepID=UPI003D341FEF
MSGPLIKRSGGRGGRRSGRGRRAMSEINVTPFVDVMLVLLIIFMVAAPLLTVGVPLELPETDANPLPQSEEEPLSLQLALDGRIFVQTAEVAPEALIPTLQAMVAERADDKIFLRADRGIEYGRVMEIMGQLNAGGFRSIGLVTDPAGAGGAEEDTQ